MSMPLNDSFHMVSQSQLQRFDWRQWQAFHEQISGDVICSGPKHDLAAFAGGISGLFFNGVVLGDLRANAHSFQRSTQRIGKDGISFFYLQHFRKAFGSQIKAFKEIDDIRSGDLIFHDLTVPFETHHTDFEVSTLVFQRDILSAYVDVDRGYPSFRISKERAEHGLLVGLIEELRRTAPLMDRRAVSSVLRCLTELLANVLTPTCHQTPLVSEEGRHFLQMRAAHKLLQQHISDHTLSSTEVAKALGISRATVYRLFEPQGGVMQTLKRMRLARARQILVARPTLSIQRVAETCGFKNAHHFSRAFKQEFDSSPGEYRKRSAANEGESASRYISWALR